MKMVFKAARIERSRVVCEEEVVGSANEGDRKTEKAVERSPVPCAITPVRYVVKRDIDSGTGEIVVRLSCSCES